MSEKRHITPVWFFVGLLLLIYGLLILYSGLSEWRNPAPTVLSQLHAPVWWGALMVVLGIVYVLMFRPRRAA
jgi:FtsH-binding integral membrane protein